MVAAANQKGISVLSDNTDAFVLLLYYSLAQKLNPPNIKESRKTMSKVVSFSPQHTSFLQKI